MGIKDIVCAKKDGKERQVATLRYDIDEITITKIVGMTIKQASEEYKDYLDLPEENLIAKINNKEVDFSHEIQANDEVVFVKKSGRKG